MFAFILFNVRFVLSLKRSRLIFPCCFLDCLHLHIHLSLPHPNWKSFGIHQEANEPQDGRIKVVDLELVPNNLYCTKLIAPEARSFPASIHLLCSTLLVLIWCIPNTYISPSALLGLLHCHLFPLSFVVLSSLNFSIIVVSMISCDWISEDSR